MAKKRYMPEQIIQHLHEAEILLAKGQTVVTSLAGSWVKAAVCRATGRTMGPVSGSSPSTRTVSGLTTTCSTGPMTVGH